MVLFMTTTSVNAQQSSLGRLFLSPEERNALNAVRFRQDLPESEAQVDELAEMFSAESAVAIELVPQNLQLNGVLRRSDGSEIIWINGEASSSTSRAEVINNGSARIWVPDAGTIAMDVGQTWNATTRSVQETYESASSIVPPDALAPQLEQENGSTQAGSDLPLVDQTRDTLTENEQSLLDETMDMLN